MRLSVVVCTRNRAALLGGLLETFSSQRTDHEYQLLIVDNGSTDSTRDVARQFAQTLPGLVYIYEEKIGLSNARNRGWKEANGNYIGFVDDECRLPPDWMAAAYKIASTIGPDIFGGPYSAGFTTNKPPWFKDEYGSFISGNTARVLNEDEFLSGGNLFVRRDILEDLHGFRTDLGMKGNKIGGAEETQLIMELRNRKKNAVVYYDPALQLTHIVRPEKMSLYSLAARQFVSGRAHFNMTRSSAAQVSFGKTFWRLRQFLKESLRAFVKRDLQQYPCFQNYLVERSFGYLWQLGYDFESFRGTQKGEKG